MKTKAGIEKSLAEWTVREIIEFCKQSRPCPNETCQLWGICDATDISVWDLSEKKRFTDREVQDAQNIVRIMGSKDIAISRNINGETLVSCTREFGGFAFMICRDLFPSIQINERFCVSEIIGGSDA